mmetsp:Transcript_87586/g.249111  ORF Transcript_87586/g.249111 Transcript_87586/m.249111 type:complete len:222 (-) Transcript_87586:655-1320(-)
MHRCPARVIIALAVPDPLPRRQTPPFGLAARLVAVRAYPVGARRATGRHRPVARPLVARVDACPARIIVALRVVVMPRREAPARGLLAGLVGGGLDPVHARQERPACQLLRSLHSFRHGLFGHVVPQGLRHSLRRDLPLRIGVGLILEQAERALFLPEFLVVREHVRPRRAVGGQRCHHLLEPEALCRTHQDPLHHQPAYWDRLLLSLLAVHGCAGLGRVC